MYECVRGVCVGGGGDGGDGDDDGTLLCFVAFVVFFPDFLFMFDVHVLRFLVLCVFFCGVLLFCLVIHFFCPFSFRFHFRFRSGIFISILFFSSFSDRFCCSFRFRFGLRFRFHCCSLFRFHLFCHSCVIFRFHFRFRLSSCFFSIFLSHTSRPFAFSVLCSPPLPPSPTHPTPAYRLLTFPTNQHTESWTLRLTSEMDQWLGVLVRHQADKVREAIAIVSLVCSSTRQHLRKWELMSQRG